MWRSWSSSPSCWASSCFPAPPHSPCSSRMRLWRKRFTGSQLVKWSLFFAVYSGRLGPLTTHILPFSPSLLVPTADRTNPLADHTCPGLPHLPPWDRQAASPPALLLAPPSHARCVARPAPPPATWRNTWPSTVISWLTSAVTTVAGPSTAWRS